jgi:hypothetical protein
MRYVQSEMSSDMRVEKLSVACIVVGVKVKKKGQVRKRHGFEINRLHDD